MENEKNVSQIIKDKHQTATTVAVSPRITITKTTLLTPSQKIQQQPQKSQPTPPKPLYTTLSAKQAPPKSLGKVVISKGLKGGVGIIKPISKPNLTGINYNVAVVAAKRPQLTIVATNPANKGSTTTNSNKNNEAISVN